MMKNIVHSDAKKFWVLRKSILSNSNQIFRYFKLRRMYSIERKYNCVIPLQSNISDEGFVTPHGLMGIFISKGAVIGKNCIIFQQVTIGSNTMKGSKHIGSPIIGDDVLIGANAIIIGGIKIGNHVKIGAGCTVSEDVPDNASVVGVKPRIIIKNKLI